MGLLINLAQVIREEKMAYFLYQSVLITTIAFIAGAFIGWWLHHYYGKGRDSSEDNDLGLVKDYLAESIKENARLKVQLRNTEDKVDQLSESSNIQAINGVDFEAFQAFEDTMKQAQMRKYLN